MKASLITLLTAIGTLICLDGVAQIDKSKFVGTYYGMRKDYAPGSSTPTVRYNQIVYVYNDSRPDTLLVKFQDFGPMRALRLMEDSTLFCDGQPARNGKFSGLDSLRYNDYSPSGQGAYIYEFNGHKSGTEISEKSDSDPLIFPNPASDFITFIGSLRIEEVSIYDGSGKLIQKISETDLKKVDVSKLNTGIYTLAVQTEYSRFSKKIVKL